MKNKTGLVAVSLFLIALFVLVFARSTVFAVNSTVTICHATESETNPYLRLVVSENAIGGHFENNGTPKSGHEDDFLFQGVVDCPGGENQDPTNTPTPTNTYNDETPTPTEGGSINEGNINIPCMFNSCPTPTVTPLATPTATPTAGPTATPAPQGGTGGGSSDGGSSSSSNGGGTVQAATTLASTGTFMDTIMNIVALAGISSLGFGAFRYAKKNS